MDHSPRELEEEIDHLSRDAAVEYLMMPERVKKIEGQVEVLGQRLEELTGLLTQVFGSMVSQERKEEDQRRVNTYLG